MGERCEIEASVEGGAAVVAVSGSVSEHDCGRLAAAIRGAAGLGVSRVIIDLVRTTYLSSAALAQMIAEQKRLPEGGPRLSVVCTSGRMRTIFATTGIDRQIGMFESLGEAMAAPTGAGQGGN